MSAITRLEPGKRMSNAVIHNGTVYLAGQVGEPGDDVATQTRTVLAEIDRLLALGRLRQDPHPDGADLAGRHLHLRPDERRLGRLGAAGPHPRPRDG